MITLAWLIRPGAPVDLLCAELEKSMDSSREVRIQALLSAEEKGWIKLLGAAKGSPGDVRAVISEHFDLSDHRKNLKKKGYRNG